MKYAVLAAIACLAIGWKMGWIPIGQTVDKLGQRYQLDFKHAVKKGMKEDEVIRAIGLPDERLNDPTSGLTTWVYKHDEETLLVSFSMDEVADVRTTRL